MSAVSHTRTIACLALLALSSDPAAAQSAQLEIKQRIETLRESVALTIQGRTIRPSELLAGAYERRAFVPLWSDAARRAELRRAIARLEYDGLDPQHYHLSALEITADLPASDAARADMDLLYTDALLRAARDLRFGRVAADASGLRTETDLTSDQVPQLLGLVALHPDSALDRMRPRHFVYSGLAAAYEDLSIARDGGGWTAVPAMLMKPGTVHEAVAALRRRLAEEGDLPPGEVTNDSLFDDRLAVAVRRWQHRHGLNEDGVVGPATHRELNVPLADRIDQLRVNLERARWIAHELAPTFVAVNVAGARVYYVRSGEVRFEARAIVGTMATRTPVFAAQLRYIDLNPTWTVPPGIVPEVLTAIRRHPGYLSEQSMRVLDRGGRSLNAASIDFGRYSGRTFPYVFRQEPGPFNPLGSVKFVFPNRYNVYLHDTPARELFQHDQRTFSHGCIRVQNPLALAEQVLDDSDWTQETLRAAIAGGGTRTVPLASPIPVLILYWTASTDLHGELHFYQDVYGRDTALLRALREH